MQSINPVTGAVIREYHPHTAQQAAMRIDFAQGCFEDWRNTTFEERGALLRKVGELLRAHRTSLSHLMADEMGKRISEAKDELEKCAKTCEYYAAHAESMLEDEPIETEFGTSFITYRPLGVILAIMPWNFPFWQVIRFAAPNLMAGNVAVLKHASNVCGSALALEEIFSDAGFPQGAFTTLLVESSEVDKLIEHPDVRGVTLTGSATAGKAVAAKAGSLVKKTVLELGGSDAYVILADADIEAAAAECAKSRLQNAGQSCIAAKRFIAVTQVKEFFEQAMLAEFQKIKAGDPTDETFQMGPLARADLRDQLHKQVSESITQGARLLIGGQVPEGPGAFYPATILADVKPGMVAFDEELFGPVAAIIEAEDEDEAFALANQSVFGLGSAIFTSNVERGRELARTHLDAGQTFVNTMVKSHPRLPFGGTKESGYGRELSCTGIREFMNVKTVVIA